MRAIFTADLNIIQLAKTVLLIAPGHRSTFQCWDLSFKDRTQLPTLAPLYHRSKLPQSSLQRLCAFLPMRVHLMTEKAVEISKERTCKLVSSPYFPEIQLYLQNSWRRKVILGVTIALISPCSVSGHKQNQVQFLPSNKASLSTAEVLGTVPLHGKNKWGSLEIGGVPVNKTLWVHFESFAKLSCNACECSFQHILEDFRLLLSCVFAH